MAPRKPEVSFLIEYSDFPPKTPLMAVKQEFVKLFLTINFHFQQEQEVRDWIEAVLGEPLPAGDYEDVSIIKNGHLFIPMYQVCIMSVTFSPNSPFGYNSETCVKKIVKV